MFQNQDSTTLLPCRVFTAHPGTGVYLTRLLLSPDIKLLATCSSDHTVKIWKIDMNEEYLEELPDMVGSGVVQNGNYTNGTASSTTSLSLSQLSMQDRNAPDQRNGQNSTQPPASPRLTDLITSRRPLPCNVSLDNHQRWVWDCAFSADSAYLVTVCSDHYARLWELSSATIIRQYNGHHRGAVCVALNDYSSPA
jgi:target of rapamycin complex subunit LST8